MLRTKYRYLWSRGEEETLCQPTFYAVWIRISRGYSSVYANSTYVASLFFEILPKIPRENGRRPIGNIENSTIVSAVFWILTTRSRRMEEGREQKGGKEVGKRKKYDKKGRDIRKVRTRYDLWRFLTWFFIESRRGAVSPLPLTDEIIL